jgi:integrase
MGLKLTRRKGSAYWQITGTLNGVRVRDSTGTDKKAVAERLRIQREQEILETSGKSSPNYTLAHAVIEYVENGGENKFLDRVVEHLGRIPLNELTQENIDQAARQAYADYKKGDKGNKRSYKKSTIRRQFYVPLAAVLHYAADIGWTHYRRVRMPKAERPAPEWGEPEWFKALWPHCDDMLRALTTFLPFTGCRIQECLDLTWKDVNLKEGWAYIRITKNREHRTAYLPEPVINTLKAIRKDEGKVFDYKDRDEVRRRLKTACRKAKIPYMSTHKIGSHTYATWMRRYAGMDARGLLATGRWKDQKSTYHYTHTTVSEEARKADVLTHFLTQN